MFSETNFHLIGIGGIGVSGLARILRAQGKSVCGSDLESSPVTDKLVNEGFTIQFGQSAEHLAEDAEVVIHTTAVREDNPELSEARRRDLKILTYPEALGIITREKKLIAVAGAHGKTTTTSLIISACLAAGEDISCLVGTNLLELDGGNARVGTSPWFVLEACEYQRAFLNLTPEILVVTNIEAEHLDYYADLKDYQSAFVALAEKLPTTGILVANSVEANLEPVISVAPHFQNTNVSEGDTATCRLRENELNLKIPGAHNRKNAALALALAEILELDYMQARRGIENFSGGARRFELRGEFQGAQIYDDYGHHPTEIVATLAGAREKFPTQRMIVVYQQHQLDRATKFLFKLGQSFHDADLVVIPNIYQVRDESTNLKITAEILAREIRANGKETYFTHDLDTTVAWLREHVQKDDVVIVMGAGNVFRVTEKLFA